MRRADLPGRHRPLDARVFDERGAARATLLGCTVYGCSAEAGAGVAGSTIRNSIVWENRLYATDKKGVRKLGNLSNITEGKKTLYKNVVAYTDSSPKPAGTGNIAKDPLFVDPDGGDFRLQYASPAKNKGKAAYAYGERDLGGRPRAIGAPDMGAHERVDGTLVPADYDGDGIADAAYFDAATATWIIEQSRDGLCVAEHGDAKGLPVPADYDGDGRADKATYSAAAKTPLWRIDSAAFPEPIAIGAKDAQPIAADLDGDGAADIVAFQGNAKKPAWTVLESASGYDTGAARTLVHGTKGATAVSGDFDGDGRADLGCYTPAATKPAFSMLLSSTGYATAKALKLTLGAKGATPCCGDFDGDGIADFAAYSGAAKTPTLYRILSTSLWRETRTLPFGAKGSRAAPGDWDGDGAADPAIEYRGAWWHLTRDWALKEIPAP